MAIRVPRVREIAILPEPLTQEHQVRVAVGADKRRWVAKPSDQFGFSDILAEVIGWLLGQQIGVPLPDAAVHQGRNQVVATWLSEYLQPANHFSDSRSLDLYNLDDLGTILALDAVIYNADRHSGNLLHVSGSDQGLGRLVAIDHGNALVGQIKDLVACDLEPPPIDSLAQFVLRPGIEAQAHKAASRLSKIPASTVTEIVKEGCHLVSEVENEPLLTAALCRRVSCAARITKAYVKRIQGRR